MNRLIFALAAALSFGPAIAAPRPAEREATIPFATGNGIRDFDAIDRTTVYIEGRGGQWYRARLAGPCPELPYAIGIGVDTGPGGSLSRGDALLVKQERCVIASLVKSGEPPRKARKGSR